jgi:hypothetical protein
MGARAVLEPVFRNELIYHIDLGNTEAYIDNSVDIPGSNHSVFDQPYGLDAVTGKSWGYKTDGWGWTGTGNKWNTMREANYQANPEGQTYDLEVEPGDYIVQIGWYENWGSRTQNVTANGVVVVPEIVSLPSDYLIEEFEVSVATNMLSLGFKSLNANNAYYSWFKVGKKCVGDDCATKCFDPMCQLRTSLYTGVPVSVKNDFNLSLLKVYPNPANNSVIVELDARLFKSIQMIDLTGKVVLNAEVENSITRLNVNHLQNGIYLVKAIGNQGIKIQKLIISK